jgi:hypothetical protein
MKRSLVVVTLLALILSAFVVPDAAAAKKKKKKKGRVKITRTVEFEYACPCVGLFQLGGLTGGDPNLGGGPIPVGSNDLFLTGEAEDQTGGAVAVNVQQDDGTGANKATGEFCTKTEEPIALDPGMEIRIFVGGPCADNTPTMPLGGTITFTLSNLP